MVGEDFSAMRDRSSPHNASLLDILVDGFEKNEMFDGYHWRDLPMPDADSAARKFEELAEEARRWKGEPARTETGLRRLVAWDDLEIRQVGRGIRVRARAPRFDDWWHEAGTWAGDPMGEMWRWLDE